MIGMTIFVVVVGAYAAIAAWTDFRTYRIPNYLTVPTAVLGLAFHTLSPATSPAHLGPLRSIEGFAIGFALLLIPWLAGGGGMGDVKLLAALGAWLGPKWLLWAFAISALIASGIALAILLRDLTTKGLSRTGRKFAEGLAPTTNKAASRSFSRRIVPFSVPVALATWIVLALMFASMLRRGSL